MMNADEIKELVESQVAESEDLRRRTSTLFGPKGKDVNVDHFEVL